MELSPLDRALAAARRGHSEAARRLLDDVLASDPGHEEALLWRARVSETDAERAGYLERVVAQNPDNRYAAEQLAALGGAAPQPLSDTLSCPNCGGSVEVHPERGAKAVVCTYCGSVLDLSAGQLDVLGQMDPQVGPRQPVRPGDEATFFGEHHLVMGWAQYEGWDDEDRWRWDEWQLVSDTGVPRYLSHSSDEGWLIQTPVRPTPDIGRMWIDVPEGKAIISERSPARITAMQGEFTWRPRLNATLRVVEARTGSTFVSAETTADEIEVVAGPRVSERDLWTAFGRDDKIQELDARVEATRRRRRALRLAALACFAACAVYALGVGYAASKGTVVGSSSTEFVAQERGLPAPAPRPDTRVVVRERADVGAVDVDDPGEAYQVTVRAEPPPGTSGRAAADLYVQEPNGTVHRLGTLRPAGAGTQATVTFRPRTAGEHTLAAFVEDSSPERLTFAVVVRKGLWSPGPFALAVFAAGLLGVVLFLGGGFGRIE